MKRPSFPAMIALVALATVLAACGDDDGGAASTRTTTPPATAGPTPPGSASPEQTTSAVPTQEPTTASSAELKDGRHVAFVTAIDVPGRTLTVDVVQFLTGEEAKEAYAEDHPEDPGGPPNDYYIVNENPRLRTLPVATDVEVIVLWLGGGADPETISFDQLPSYFTTNPPEDKTYAWYAPFWLTVDEGVIVSIEEQYIP